jgi:hypothetical protein
MKSARIVGDRQKGRKKLGRKKDLMIDAGADQGGFFQIQNIPQTPQERIQSNRS